MQGFTSSGLGYATGFGFKYTVHLRPIPTAIELGFPKEIDLARKTKWFENVTDDAAVLRAIEEFDSMGRDRFLKKYGFGTHRTYFVLHDGRKYDCKPLLCAAYNQQYMPDPLLKNKDCASSGTNPKGKKSTVQKRFEELGFYVLGQETPSSLLQTSLDSGVRKSLADSSDQRRKRLQVAAKIPARITTTSTAFVRNPDVIAEVLHRANGVCEGCNSPAPFQRASDDSPYLEVHHRMPLADGGEDTTENATALCPNCHRDRHFGVKYVERIR